MLSLFRQPIVAEVTITSKEIKHEAVVEAARKVSFLSGLMNDINESSPDSEWLTTVNQANKRIDDKTYEVEELLRRYKDQGDIHVLRALNDIRTTQRRLMDVVGTLTVN